MTVSATDPFAGGDEVAVTHTATGRNANQRYAAAQAVLRKAHQEEFLTLLEAEYVKDGLTFRRRVSAEERERAAFEAKRQAAINKIAELEAKFGLA